MRTQPFVVCSYSVVSRRDRRRETLVEAVVEVRVGPDRIRRSAEGVGPVHALDKALRLCLEPHFPELGMVHLSDYRVSVLDAEAGTGAKVRVLIQATDGTHRWDAGCVSENVIDASFEALCATAVMGIMRPVATNARDVTVA